MINDQNIALPCSKGNQGFYSRIIERSIGELDAMQSLHSRVLLFRVDLHLNHFSTTNKIMSDFFRKFKKKARKRFNQRDIAYVWCREQANAPTQHYHLVIMVNGNKNRYPKYLIDLIEEIWEGWELPAPYVPKHCYYLIERGDQQAYSEACQRLMYLAKVATKGNRPASTNDYGCSQVYLKVKNH